MSIAPPGYPTDETDPGSGNRQADDNVQYEYKSVQALRGRVSSAKAKWQNQGWEFVSENRGTLRTELNFRRMKPKTAGAYLLSIVASVRRLRPKTQLVMVASCTLILAAGIIGMVVGTPRGGDTAGPSAAQTPALTAPSTEPTNPSAAQTPAPTAPPADPTVTDQVVDELNDDLDEIDDELDSALAPDRAGTAYYRNCTEAREAGVAPLNEGDDGYRSGLDREGDGIACEN